MTHAEQILRAAVAIGRKSPSGTFTRDEVRRHLSLSRSTWMSGYTAVFQGMRIDQPGGAPAVAQSISVVFQQVGHGTYQLTGYGKQLAKQRGF